MKVQIFTVRDRQSLQYGSPLFFPTAGVCIRSISAEVNKGGKESLLASNPEDFELFHIGSWDTETCAFDLHPPKSVALLQNLKVNGST